MQIAPFRAKCIEKGACSSWESVNLSRQLAYVNECLHGLAGNTTEIDFYIFLYSFSNAIQMHNNFMRQI